MTPRRPRIVLGSAIVLLLALLAFFAIGLRDNRATQRASAEQRFRDAAGVTASLTESLFASSTRQAAERDAAAFGGPAVSLRALNERRERDRVTYALVLDDRGEPLAVTPGAGPAALRRIAAQPDHIRRVVEGRSPYRLSGVLAPQTMEIAAGFETPDGERRVLVEGFPPALIAGFLSTYVQRLPEADRQQAAIVDSADRIITTAGAGALGARLPDPGPDRTTVEAPVGGTEWRVVLSQRKASLYRDVSSELQWLVLIALALVGAAVVALLARAARRDADLQAAYAELERTNAELLRSNGELEQFASVASHDLQEPLRKVQAFGEHLARRFGDDIPEEGQDYLRRMRSASERMSLLIDDLLRLSRVTTHAKPPERVDLTILAHEVVGDLDARHCVLVDELPVVDGDPVQLRQLLQNLIANGVKFRREGVAPLVRVRSREASAPGRVAFAVCDNGIGFADEHAERIFHVFERLHSRDVYPGTGIGLALCRRIVERHGGAITAEGRPGEGSVFTVELPAATLPAAADPEARREPSLV